MTVDKNSIERDKEISQMKGAKKQLPMKDNKTRIFTIQWSTTEAENKGQIPSFRTYFVVFELTHSVRKSLAKIEQMICLFVLTRTMNTLNDNNNGRGKRETEWERKSAAR